jgi:hypothetical protein
MADENDWVGKENKRIAKRRERLGVAPPEVAKGKSGKPGAWGLALSGGGIRSATFSLGVLQALAQAGLDDGKGGKTPWLRLFDYLSTVSGGGYMGAFFVSLFQPRRLEPERVEGKWWRPVMQMAQEVAQVLPKGMRGRWGGAEAKAGTSADEKDKKAADCLQAANHAYEVLKDDPPGRVRSRDRYDWRRRPLAWLRENGRYLTPTGAGDYLYAAGLAIRNWFSLHYVIGSALFLLFALVAFVKSSAAVYQPGLVALFTHDPYDFFASSAWAIPDPSAWSLWWSPLWVLPLAVFVLWLAPSGIAYWLTSSRDSGAAQGRLARTFTLQAWIALALALVLWRLPVSLAGEGLIHLETGAWLLAALVLIAFVFHAGAALTAENNEGQRVRQTRVLASGLKLALGLAVLAVLDTLSQTFYFWLSHAGSVLWRVLTPGVLFGALVWAVRKLATGGGKPLLPKWLPLSALACAGAVLLLAVVATVWAMLVQWLLWGLGPSAVVNGDVLAAQYPTTLFLVALGLLPTLINGLFPSFINLSTLQAFYSARLTRAYLGASNGARFHGEEGRRYASAAEPHPLDPIAREAYYDEDVLAPLHLINVTMDLTVDPTEQLVQRDRKGIPLAVGPTGYLLDGWYQPHWTGRGDYPIGEWIGVSGAAFTTGLGRATSLGLSLLLGLANVRLGLWWRSKLGTNDVRPGLEWLALKVFPTQTYLGYELAARFHGAHRARQYLSDGGHFENTAVYELLRPEREVEVIVACDDGCDPDYQFADVANLIRLSRIDHRARFDLVSDFPGSGLGAIFGRDEDFTEKGGGAGNKCALLYRVTYPGGHGRARWLVVLKPRLVEAAPLDVWQYKQANETFPQETTTDQFFDEAQWESYRRLGLMIGTLVFGGENGAKLIERLKLDP